MRFEPIRPLRVYADTSVYGGAFDDEFQRASKEFFRQVRERQIGLVNSALVRDELVRAPLKVRELFEEMAGYAQFVSLDAETYALHEAYMAHNIVSSRWSDDALHVAIATTAGCPILVSWNFKHIVHHNKTTLYNGVNQVLGLPIIKILSPQEVIFYEE